jgi:hypothetical protein
MTVYLTKDAVLDFNKGPRLFYISIVATDNGSPPASGNFIIERAFVATAGERFVGAALACFSVAQ